MNEAHPERNTDVIIFLDTFVEAREDDESTLDFAVRAAASLADHYLERKDRVGLISFGGYLNWLLPSSGLVQLYRIVDSLLDTEIILSYAWKGADVLPSRTLPPKALVIALSPCSTTCGDDAARPARARLRPRRRRGLADPVRRARKATEELAYRLWHMKREALRAQFMAAGIMVVPWQEGQPLAAPLEEVTRLRQSARIAHA